MCLMSHANSLPLAHGKTVVPSGCLLYLVAGICICLMASQRTSFMSLHHWCPGEGALPADSPSSTLKNNDFNRNS